MPRYLADTSAWNRSRSVADRWARLIERNELYVCTPVKLELLYSARGRRDYADFARDLTGFPVLELTGSVEAAALRTQALLAERSQHRGPTPTDLLIAATAEAHDAILLHYDRHFDAITRVTRQPAEWVARRGSLD